MNDTITLQGIQVNCILGCYPEERTTPRPVCIDLTLHTDCAAAALSDNLQDALDYDSLTQRIIDLTQASTFNLVESLADRIAQLCLEEPKVLQVTVSVTKPHPRENLRAAIVTLTRQRHDASRA